MITYDEKKGYSITGSGFIVNYETDKPHSCGLDLLPWDAALLNSDDDEAVANGATADNPADPNTQVNQEANEDDITAERPANPKAMTKQQRKEMRQNKKIAAALKRKAKREQELKATGTSNTTTATTTINPHEVAARLNSEYTKLLKVSKEGVPPADANSDYKILQYHSVALYKSDLSHILPEEWLCDNNITFVYELILHRLLKPLKFNHQICLLSPALVQLFSHIPFTQGDSTELLESILPMKELEKSKFVFIPALDNEDVFKDEANTGDHWFLCVLSILESKLYIYDSMSSDDDDDKYLKELALRLQSCKSLVKGKIEIVKMNCQQQDNFDDCGVFLLMYSSTLLNRLIRIASTDSDDNTNDFDAENGVSMDITKVKLEPLLGRLYLLILIQKLYRNGIID